MKTQIQIHHSAIVNPSTFQDCLKRCRFHSVDLSGNEYLLNNNLYKPKEVFLVSGSNHESLDTQMNSLNLRMCIGSSYYLLGLIGMYKNVRSIEKDLWGKYIVAIDYQHPLFVCAGHVKTFLAVDLTNRYLRLLKLAYQDSIDSRKCLILAESI